MTTTILTETPNTATIDATDMRGQLATGRRAAYVLAGDATVTVRSTKSGSRFTYQVTKSDEQPGRPAVHFVRVLAGADNTGNYVYLGTIFADGNFRVTRKSRVAADAPSAVAFAWFVRNLESAKVDVWHDGTCGRCGRKLTVPESIESGLGPVCAGRGAALDSEPVAPVAAAESTPAKELLAERRARAEAIVDAATPRVPFTPAERAMLVDWGTEPESTPAVGATVAPAIPRWAF